ncbi:MAG: hypothetical protein PHY28_01500, partial [Dehalococcoidales bacterium]|nr:hypothetical protein [Dehalococcoidales bacterium]
MIKVRSWTVNITAIDISAASSVLKNDKTAIVKNMAIIEARKAFRPALAVFKTRSSSLFCFLFA